MKSMTVQDFLRLANGHGWEREESVFTGTIPKIAPGDQERPIVIDGHVSLTSTFKKIKVIYRERFSYTLGDEDSFDPTTAGVARVWSLEGIKLVDQDGNPERLSDIFEDLPVDFSWIHYDDIKDAIFRRPHPDFMDQDTGTDDAPVVDSHRQMQDYNISADGKPNLRFKGYLVAHVASEPKRLSRHDADNDAGRWTELSLYLTQSGKYVCSQVGKTIWEGEHDRHTAFVCDNASEVIEFFGHRWLAKSLYRLAGIDDSVEI